MCVGVEESGVRQTVMVIKAAGGCLPWLIVLLSSPVDDPRQTGSP